jgi:hypothetical protein
VSDPATQISSGVSTMQMPEREMIGSLKILTPSLVFEIGLGTYAEIWSA